MKVNRLAAFAAVIMLAGCASTEPSATTSRWWDPLDWSWSRLAPWHWFGSSLTISEQGVDQLSGGTPMNVQAIQQALGDDYQIRQGMRNENGRVVRFFQALKEQQVRLVINGDKTISRIEVTDTAAVTTDGSKIGTPFSKLYVKAYNACQKSMDGDSNNVWCKAPESEHISYIFNGEWHGPQALMPADDTLKSWRISEIIWQR